jgi:hypothetical protein
VWTVRLRVRDNRGLESDPQASWVTVADTNQPPELAAPIPDQTAPANRWFRYTFGSDTFVDFDRGQTLTYAAAQPDGTPLPAWLVFDAATRSFAGRPLVRDAGPFRVRVTAIDSGSPSLTAWDEFSLTVTPQPFPYHNADLPQDVDGDGSVEPQDALIVINWINAHGSVPVPDSWSEVTADPFYFFDVYADNLILPIDVLTVINYLNGGSATTPQAGEAEGFPVAAASRAVPAEQTELTELRRLRAATGEPTSRRVLEVLSPVDWDEVIATLPSSAVHT